MPGTLYHDYYICKRGIVHFDRAAGLCIADHILLHWRKAGEAAYATWLHQKSCIIAVGHAARDLQLVSFHAGGD